MATGRATITEEMLARHLYTDGLPDPDLLIRTSGEMRVSNFLLWQIAYAEIFVTETLWPDFNRARLLEALVEFQKRERRYGGIHEGRALDGKTRAGCRRIALDDRPSERREMTLRVPHIRQDPKHSRRFSFLPRDLFPLM